VIVAEQNHRRLAPADLRDDIDRHLALLTADRSDLARRITARIAPSRLAGAGGAAARRAWDVTAAARGGAARTGHAHRRQVAALVGVAPIAHDSGRRRGALGRAGERPPGAYMAAVTAGQHNRTQSLLSTAARERRSS
jgi:transposase